jgi:hypothetical protein
VEIDVTEYEEEIVYNARPGPQTLKVIEIMEKTDERGEEFLDVKFVNQWEEYHIEKFYPRHFKRLYHIASAIGDECFFREAGATILNTDEMVGGYFHATLEHSERHNGEQTRGIYIRDIRATTRRKDLSGSRHFKRSRRRKTKGVDHRPGGQ